MMIFINHIPDNPATLLTMRWWGFADSAEIFVFISGFNAMLAIGGYFSAGGLLAGVLRVCRRIWQLFCAHVLLVFALAVIVAAAGELTDSKPIMAQLNFSPLFVETDSAILRLARLNYMPTMTNILPLYIFFVALFPLIWVSQKISPFLTLALSGGVWLWANITNISFTGYPDEVKWFFNPLAWQFLFVCGALAARYPQPFQWLKSSKMAFILAIGFVFFAFLAAAPWTHYESFVNFRLLPDWILTYDNKQNLSALRLVYFSALVFMAIHLFPANSAFWQTPFARTVGLCGRHGMAVYCVGAALALIASILVPLWQLDLTGKITANIIGLALLIALSYILSMAQQHLKKISQKMRQQGIPSA